MIKFYCIDKNDNKVYLDDKIIDELPIFEAMRRDIDDNYEYKINIDIELIDWIKKVHNLVGNAYENKYGPMPETLLNLFDKIPYNNIDQLFNELDFLGQPIAYKVLKDFYLFYVCSD